MEAENEPENEPNDNAVLEAEPADNAVPQNDPDAAEEAAVIDNAKSSEKCGNCRWEEVPQPRSVEEHKVEVMFATVGPNPKDGVKSTPSASHMFHVNPDVKPLKEATLPTLKHRFTISLAQRHFLCKRSWPDLQTAVAF